MKLDALIAPDESQFAFTPRISGFASNDGSTDTITVPDAELLFQGTFKRDGDDLKIVGKDGNAFLVDDYFRHDKKPALLSPEGASLTSAVVEALAGPLAAGQYAQAGAPQPGTAQAIGRVEKAEGNVSVVRNGITITLNVGDVVMKGDVVQTGAGGSLGLIFTDGTAFNLAANARMVLNDFVYNAAGGNNSALISLVQGSISFVAGQVAKTGDMKVETPVATMGIRGTAVLVEIDANNGQTKFSVMVEPNGTTGSFNLYDKSSGALIGTVNNSAIGWVVTPTGPLTVLAQQVQKSPAELARELAIVQQVFQTFNTGPFDPNAPQQQQQQQQDPQRRGDNPQGTQTAGSSTPPTTDTIKVTVTQVGSGNNQTNNNQNNNTNNSNNSDTNGSNTGDNTPTTTETTIDTPTLNPISGSGEINGTAGADYITGSNDVDTINAMAGNDFVFAFGGNDFIIAGHGEGNDYYDGGDGENDIIQFPSALANQPLTFHLYGFGDDNTAEGDIIGFDVFTNIERIESGAGDDTFNVYTATNWHIDAGAGMDTVFLKGDLDITGNADGPDIRHVEIIDLNTTHSNTVDLDIEGVLDAIDGNDTGYLVIEGTSADRVNLSNEDGCYQGGVWRRVEEDESPVGPGYDLYVFQYGEFEARVYIDSDIKVATLIEEGADGKGTSRTAVEVEGLSYVMSGWTAHYYAFVEAWGTSWNDAQDAAAAEQDGYLANITSAYENEFIADIVDDHVINGENAAFIGGALNQQTGFWEWTNGPEDGQRFWEGGADGTATGYTNWRMATGEPNSMGYEDYLAMEGDGTWNDVSDNHAFAAGYVVEFDSEPWYFDGSVFTQFVFVGTYGAATFDVTTGVMTYYLDNADLQTQALTEGQVVTESFDIVVVGDSNEQVTRTVEFTIAGTNDAPVIETNGIYTEDGNEAGYDTDVFGLSVSDPDAEEHITITAQANDGQLKFTGTQDQPSETLTFEGTVAEVNAKLRTGVSYLADENPAQTDKVTLTITDSHGATDTVNFIFNVTGQSGADLIGTEEKDIIFGTGNDDTMTGGAKSDAFVFSFDQEEDNIGFDTIGDFKVGDPANPAIEKDQLVFVNSGYESFEQIECLIDEDEFGNAVIDLGEGDSITLTGVDPDQLHASNFVFHPGFA